MDDTYTEVVEPIAVTKRGCTSTDLVSAKDMAGRTPGVLACGDSSVAPMLPHRPPEEEEETRVAILKALVDLKADPTGT